MGNFVVVHICFGVNVSHAMEDLCHGITRGHAAEKLFLQCRVFGRGANDVSERAFSQFHEEVEDVFWAIEMESKDFDDVVVIVETQMKFGAAFLPFHSLLCQVLAHLLYDEVFFISLAFCNTHVQEEMSQVL